MVPDLFIAVRLVGDVVVPLPQYQTAGSAGLDLHAALKDPATIAPLGRLMVPTGLSVEIPDKFEGQVRPRSGLAAKHGVTVLNAPGTVDSDYRGEIKVMLVNLSDTPVVINPLDRVAQLVLAPVARAELRLQVGELAPTRRGRGGHGSTGV